MGSVLNRVAGGFLSIAIVLFLTFLAFMGWYRYLEGGICLLFGFLTAFVSTAFKHKESDEEFRHQDPFATPLTRCERTAYSIICVLATLILFTFAFLLLAGYIE